MWLWKTSVPLSVYRLMQVNPCTRALALALGGLVSLRWDRRAWLTLLAQELRWLSSDSLPTSTELGPTQTRQLLSTVTWPRGPFQRNLYYIRAECRHPKPSNMLEFKAWHQTIYSKHVNHPSLCMLECSCIVWTTKGYHHCRHCAYASPQDPFSELPGQSVTRPPRHWCHPPGRTASEATPLHAWKHAQLKSCTRPYRTPLVCEWLTVRWSRVDEGLLAVDAHTALVVQEGVVGGAPVAHHVLSEVLQNHVKLSDTFQQGKKHLDKTLRHKPHCPGKVWNEWWGCKVLWTAGSKMEYTGPGASHSNTWQVYTPPVVGSAWQGRIRYC